MKALKKRSTTSLRPAPEVSTLLTKDYGPLTEEEREREQGASVTRLLESEKKKIAKARAIVIDQCERDPYFLEGLLKELKPMRGPGFTKPAESRNVVIAAIIENLKDHPPQDIWETISITCKVGIDHAKRLYYAEKKINT